MEEERQRNCQTEQLEREPLTTELELCKESAVEKSLVLRYAAQTAGEVQTVRNSPPAADAAQEICQPICIDGAPEGLRLQTGAKEPGNACVHVEPGEGEVEESDASTAGWRSSSDNEAREDDPAIPTLFSFLRQQLL
jgi:hypothetical protein